LATAFPRTARSLQADRFSGVGFLLLLGVILLIGWLAWAIAGQVTVYVSSENARLETERAVFPVDAPMAGQVVGDHLELGRSVEVGDVLVELDVQPQKLALAEEKARAESAEQQLALAKDILEIERKVLKAFESARGLAIAEGRAKRREAEALARLAQQKAKQWEALRASGLVSGVEMLEASSSAEQRRDNADAQRFGVDRMAQDRRAQEVSQTAAIERLRRESGLLEGELVTRRATIARLEYEIDRRIIRAPVAGKLGQISSVRTGSFVESGQRLATVVPQGKVKAVGYFPPAESAGRIVVGQCARLRLDGFPWAQYGVLRGTVARVATEPLDGKLRVELDVDASSNPRIPLQHGLPGSFEVEVERVSPALLALRAAGRLVSAAPSNEGTTRTKAMP
jgi:multidrug resistance efflux pump